MGLGKVGIEAMRQEKRAVWPGMVVPGLRFSGSRQEARLRSSNPTID
jgi:hypothetical protein